ncbi:MAG TPA: hypothetical protein DCL54_01650 [Alphaproteobacteria bacterium]|nr:hypothetical protein [Alphaproteobacteria bacterium]HAJ45271.1 hypothetical protein [Alphaproteobacteria bacterium]
MSPRYIEKLRHHHAELDRQIDKELHQPLPDSSWIKEAKRQKLLIKDKIVALMREEQFARA